MLQTILFAWIPWAINLTVYGLHKVYSIVNLVYTECYIQKEIVFLKNNILPISSASFKDIDNSNVKWRCSIDPILMIDPACYSTKSQHLSYLGFTVKIPGIQDIDISSWINDVRYIGLIEPSLSEVFILWCFTTGVSYFHCMDSITIEIIDDLGNTLIKGLNE